MDMDFDKDFQSKPEHGSENDREEQSKDRSSYKDVDRGEAARAHRPRIRIQRAYSSEQTDNRPSFRPEGFGSALMNSDQQEEGRQYRPRYSRASGYQPRREGGYRPRYNRDESKNGYQQRRESGYRPRDYREGGAGEYRSYRPGNYRPRYQNNGESDYQSQFQDADSYRRPSGYRPRGGYSRPYQQRGGYGQRGYRPNGYYRHTEDYDPNAKYSNKKRIEYNQNNVDPEKPIRLNKFLANSGICSRREADEYIQAGAVTVNGQIITELGSKVTLADEVKFRGQIVSPEKKVYILLNKPKGYVTTSDDPQERKTVMDLVKGAAPERIYPVGRLDRNTTGVLLFTNDGDLASKLTHPKFLKKKVYHVFLDRNVAGEDIQKIAEGIELEDGEVHADAISYVDDDDKKQVGIEIHSGKNRIVRRIFERLGYKVYKLDRVQFAGLTKKNVRRGDWRYLSQQEVDMLKMGAFD